MSDDREPSGDDVTNVRSIAVTTDDVVAALEAAHRGTGRAVLRVTPPFAGRTRARLHRADVEADYVGEGEPLHVDPERLVGEVPPYPDPDRTEDELRDSEEEYTPAAHRERHVEAVEAWRRAVRESIVDALEVETPTGTHRIAVKTLG